MILASFTITILAKALRFDSIKDSFGWVKSNQKPFQLIKTSIN